MILGEIQAALTSGGGLIVRRDHPHLRHAFDRALADGVLKCVLPGVYVAADERSVEARVRAALALEPAAIATGLAAAALTWWREKPVPQVVMASRLRRASSPSLAWQRRQIDPELVLEEDGIRVTNPALTVLDLLPSLGGAVIDEALRRRAVCLGTLWEVFESLPARRGDAQRRRLLLDSSDEPWSEAERFLHRRYRSLALPYPYATNYRLDLPDGTFRLVDLAVPDLLLGFEADGYAFHSSPASFAHDRWSDARLAALSWQRIRFDATAVIHDDEVTTLMGEIVRAREALLRGTRPAGARVRPVKCG